jgi:TolB-like protein/Tfp pilus assembly protein PilF
MGSIALFLSEARRRRVFRTAGLYIVGAWVLLQVADLGLESLELRAGLLRYFWLTAFAGFPLALVFGWYYDVTADGIRRTPPASGTTSPDRALRIPDYAIIAALAIIAGVITAGVLDRARTDAASFSGGIAVLPLENLSGETGQDYFAAGMHDALITSLSRIAALRVVSRTSTTNLDRTLSIPDIADALGVTHVIEGSVAREGSRVRVIVQLIDAAHDTHVWADSFDREFSSVLTLQNDMALAIAKAVDVQLSDAEQVALDEQNAVDPDIYDAYLRGMHLINQESLDVRKRGIAILEDVVERDPQNALAYAGLGYGYAMLGHTPIPQWMSPASKLASARALELDDSLAEAHLSVGSLKLYYEWDFPAAEAAYRRAIALNPSLASAYLNLAYLLELDDRKEEALSLGMEAVRLDPLSTGTLVNVGAQFWVRGRYEEALDLAEKTLQIDPENGFARWLQAITYRDAGQLDKALEVAKVVRNDPAWGFAYGLILARQGRVEEARDELERFEGPPPHVLALVVLAAQLGDDDAVFRWLQVIRDDMPHPWYPWLLGWMPDLGDARHDPRMRELAAELGLEEYL